MRMKTEAYARGDVLDHKEVPVVAPLSFADVQSPMLLMGFIFALSAIVFFIVKVSGCWTQIKDVK